MTANRESIKPLVLYNDKVVGKQYGVEYAEKFHYMDRASHRLTSMWREVRLRAEQAQWVWLLLSFPRKGESSE
jgi:hypothetical protein